jgi:hypothetical protein
MKQPLVNWRPSGDVPDAYRCDYDDSAWRRVCTPHDWQIEQPRSAERAAGSARGIIPEIRSAGIVRGCRSPSRCAAVR